MEEKNVLGVIGGLGPRTTTHFMDLVASMTDAASDQDHIDMIVYNFPSIPDRRDYILGSSLKSPLPGLMAVARDLSRQGVSQIAVPSITAHFFYEELQSAAWVPILNAVTETVEALASAGVTEAGIMATDGTIVSGLLNGAMARRGIHPILPSRESQKGIMHLINDHIKAGNPGEMEAFQAVSQELWDKGAQVVVLGCTELSLLKSTAHLGEGYLDAIEVLARSAVLHSGKKLKKEYENLLSGFPSR